MILRRFPFEKLMKIYTFESINDAIAEPVTAPRARTAVRADADDTLDLDTLLPSIAPPVSLPEPCTVRCRTTTWPPTPTS